MKHLSIAATAAITALILSCNSPSTSPTDSAPVNSSPNTEMNATDTVPNNNMHNERDTMNNMHNMPNNPGTDTTMMNTNPMRRDSM